MIPFVPRLQGPPQILLIGRNGQIGWELHRFLPLLGPVTAVDYPDLDFTDRESVRQWVEIVRPRLIVNAAAYNCIDEAESNPERAMAVNANAPALLAEFARQHEALLVHFSTAHVFDGARPIPYLETDPARPLSVYGQTKLLAEKAIAASGCRHLILRTGWIYGLRGQNFLRSILRAVRQDEPLRIIHDECGTPSPSRLIAAATAQILARLHERDQFDVQALYHLAAAGSTTWYGFAKAILTRTESSHRPVPSLEAILTEGEPFVARRPPYAVLNTDRVRADFHLALPDWESALVQVLDEVTPSLT
jgi:dTDP-4-dehydrorhamnose reductase